MTPGRGHPPVSTRGHPLTPGCGDINKRSQTSAERVSEWKTRRVASGNGSRNCCFDNLGEGNKVETRIYQEMSVDS